MTDSEGAFGCAAFAMVGLCLLAILAVWGVIVWAIIQLVLWVVTK